MKKLFVVIVSFIFIASNSISAAEIFKCPSKKNSLFFSGISVFGGDPKQDFDLAPDNANSPFPHKWTLKNTSPWLVCRYGKKDKKTIAKALNGKFSYCVMMESKKGSGVFNTLSCER